MTLFTVPWCEEADFQTVTCLCLAYDGLPGKLYTGWILLVGLISVDKHGNIIMYTVCNVQSFTFISIFTLIMLLTNFSPETEHMFGLKKLFFHYH